MIDKKQYKNLDVLHLGYRLDLGYSISKIINNLIKNCPEISQNKISLKKFDNEEDTVNLINQVRPKILHLHFSSLFPEELFERINYKPYIICTVHGLKENPYKKYVDLFVCIHQGAYDLNSGNKIIIENTVDVSEYNIEHKINYDNIDFCCSCRYAKEAIKLSTIKTFSSINAPFHIYGYNRKDRVSRQIYKYMSKFYNIVPHEWSSQIENNIKNHSIYAYIKPKINPKICQGLNVMEAVSLGIPCITTKKRQDFQQYVIDGYNGFMVEDSIGFITKCNYLLKNKNKLKEIKQNAEEHKKKIKNSMPKEYSDIYREILEK